MSAHRAPDDSIRRPSLQRRPEPGRIVLIVILLPVFVYMIHLSIMEARRLGIDCTGGEEVSFSRSFPATKSLVPWDTSKYVLYDAGEKFGNQYATLHVKSLSFTDDDELRWGSGTLYIGQTMIYEGVGTFTLIRSEGKVPVLLSGGMRYGATFCFIPEKV